MFRREQLVWYVRTGVDIGIHSQRGSVDNQLMRCHYLRGKVSVCDPALFGCA